MNHFPFSRSTPSEHELTLGFLVGPSPVSPSNQPNAPLSPSLKPLLEAKSVGEELWTTHLLRSPPKPELSDLDTGPVDSLRKVSVGEELFNIHLRRESFDAAEGGEADTKKRKASDNDNEEEDKNDVDDILTAPLEVLCAPTPSPKRKVRKSARQAKKDVFTKVSEKVSKTRNY